MCEDFLSEFWCQRVNPKLSSWALSTPHATPEACHCSWLSGTENIGPHRGCQGLQHTPCNGCFQSSKVKLNRSRRAQLFWLVSRLRALWSQVLGALHHVELVKSDKNRPAHLSHQSTPAKNLANSQKILQLTLPLKFRELNLSTLPKTAKKPMRVLILEWKRTSITVATPTERN